MATVKTTTARTPRASAKATTTRTRSTATVDATAKTKAGTVSADAVVDLNRVRKPFYAYVGVADLAVAKLRTLPDYYTSSVQTAQEQVNVARGSVKTIPVVVRDQITSIPEKVGATYADLVKRGEKLVKTVRSNPNTKAAVDSAKNAKSQAKGAATSLRKSADFAADNAKNARAQAKGAVTSVRKSVSSAQKTAEATASKAG
jgi:hypothetical protein